MATLSSHGPRSMTALPWKRSTPSEPACVNVRGTGRRILHGSLEHRADELLGLEIARHDAAVSIDQRDRRAWRQCETREESSEARKVEAETENTVDHAGRRANRKRKKDRLTPGNRTDHQLAHGRTALSDDLKNERRRRRLRHPRLDARGHETTVGRAQQHVVQQRLIVQDANEHRLADVAVERAHGRMELQHRRTRVQAREVLVEHGGGGGRNRTGFVADLAGALGARQDGGPGNRRGEEQGQHRGPVDHLPKDGLSAEKPQGFARS